MAVILTSSTTRTLDTLSAAVEGAVRGEALLQDRSTNHQVNLSHRRNRVRQASLLHNREAGPILPILLGNPGWGHEAVKLRQAYSKHHRLIARMNQVMKRRLVTRTANQHRIH